MKTMTIIDPETGDILTGEICIPTRKAILSEHRELHKSRHLNKRHNNKKNRS